MESFLFPATILSSENELHSKNTNIKIDYNMNEILLVLDCDSKCDQGFPNPTSL